MVNGTCVLKNVKYQIWKFILSKVKLRSKVRRSPKPKI